MGTGPMSEVHQLKMPERVKNSFPSNQTLVEQLETLLASAKSGKLRSAAFAVVYHDDLVPDGEVGEGWEVASGTRFALSHAIMRLNHRWAEHVLKE